MSSTSVLHMYADGLHTHTNTQALFNLVSLDSELTGREPKPTQEARPRLRIHGIYAAPLALHVVSLLSSSSESGLAVSWS